MKLGLTPAQIAARRSWLGGSDAAAIVAGGDEWGKLWAIKPGRAEEDDLSGIPAVQMGSFTEPLNCYWYEKQTGRAVTRRGETARSFLHEFGGTPLGANLDGVTTTSGGKPAYIDFKHVGKSGDQMTLRYTAQCTHCALLLGFDDWALSTFVGNSKWELIEQEVDPFFAAEYLAKCGEFWGYVERDEEPPEADPLPVPPPRKLRTVTIDLESPASNWEGSIILPVTRFLDTEGAAKANAIAREEIKSTLPEDVGLCVVGLVDLKRDKAGKLTISTRRTKGEEA